MASDGNDNELGALTAELADLNARIQAQHERLMELQAFNGRQSQFLIWLAGLAVVLLFVIAWRVGADQGTTPTSGATPDGIVNTYTTRGAQPTFY